MTKLMTLSAAGSKLKALSSATDPKALQDLFVNLVHHAVINNNGSIENMARLRNSQAPTKFKAALAKYMPIKWNRKEEKYDFDKDASLQFRVDNGLIFGTGSIEETAAVLPDIFEAKKEVKEFDLAVYLGNVAKKLEKEGIEDAERLAQIVAALIENPAAISAVSATILKKSAK